MSPTSPTESNLPQTTSARKGTNTGTAKNEGSMQRVPGAGASVSTGFNIKLSSYPQIPALESATLQLSAATTTSTKHVILEDTEISVQEDSAEEQIVKTENRKHRAMSSLENDFMVGDPKSDQYENSLNFDFGVYLEYWRRGRRNSVIPKHRTFKDELTNNIFYRISEQQFIELYQNCEKYQMQLMVKANDIGVCNKYCEIPPGTRITIHHVMALKLYTDFDDLQREFKRHCRRLRIGQSVDSVIKRNREIAHWCRLLRESIMF